MKKIVTYILVLAMTLSLCASAFAETNPPSQNMDVEYEVASIYIVYVPDGGNDLIVNPTTKYGEMDIGIKAGSTIPGDKAIQMSVNAGQHYDNYEKSYYLRNSNGGQYLSYTLSYDGEVKNPGSSDQTVILETVVAESAFEGFQGKVGVTVGTAVAAGTYYDVLTFSFSIVDYERPVVA